MAVTIRNRVMQTTLTSGVGNYVLASPVMGYRTFANGFSDQELLYYAINDGDDNWEVGLGRYVFGTDSIVRVTILDSSTGGAAISWPGGGVSKNIYAVVPAENTIYSDETGAVNNLRVGSDFSAVNPGDFRLSIGIGQPTNGTFLVGNGSQWVTNNAANTRTALGIGQPTNGTFLVGDGSQWATTSVSNTRTALGIGAPTNGNFLVGNNGTSWVTTTAANSRTALGIGFPTNGNFLVGNGSQWVTTNAANSRAALGIGVPTSGSFLTGNGGSWITTDVVNTRAALGIAGLPTVGNVLIGVGSVFSAQSGRSTFVRGMLGIATYTAQSGNVAHNNTTKLTVAVAPGFITSASCIIVNVRPTTVPSNTNAGRFEAHWAARGSTNATVFWGNSSSGDLNLQNVPPSIPTANNRVDVDIYNWSGINCAYEITVTVMAAPV